MHLEVLDLLTNSHSPLRLLFLRTGTHFCGGSCDSGVGYSAIKNCFLILVGEHGKTEVSCVVVVVFFLGNIYPPLLCPNPPLVFNTLCEKIFFFCCLFFVFKVNICRGGTREAAKEFLIFILEENN